MTNNKKMYKGMGFVESLVAIILVGVASVVLMRIAASTMMEAVQNERIDKMTQFAIEGAIMTETIILEMVEDQPLDERLDYAKEKLGLEPSLTKCFVPQRVEESNITTFNFLLEGDKMYKIIDEKSSLFPSGRETEDIAIKEKDVINDGYRTDYFRYVCISAPTGDMKYLNVKVIVGHILSKGEVTANRDVKDYIYSTMISL